MEISYGAVQTKPSKKKNKKLASKQKQGVAIIMNNEALNINDIMKERLQTENLSSTHIYVLHWSRDYSCSFPKQGYSLIFYTFL